jgi:DNA-binding LacI/PurR family transcriptional regulator
LLDAILKLAPTYGCQLLIQPVNMDDKMSLQDYVERLATLDGAIAITCEVAETSWMEECKEADIPVVLIHDNISQDALQGTTVVSYIEPALLALEELVHHLTGTHRCKNIAVVMVSEQGHRLRQEKLDILRSAMLSANMDLKAHRWLYHIKEYTHECGVAVVNDILTDNASVDAIICLSDVTALGVKQELEKRGEKYIRVTGFDNIELADHFGLTSIDQQLPATGNTALIDLNHAIDTGNRDLSVRTVRTTMKNRPSCCWPSSFPTFSTSSTQRLAIYYVVREGQMLRTVEQMRNAVYHINEPIDTIDLIGNAGDFPLHITLKGIFLLRRNQDISQFLDDLHNAVATIHRFPIRVSNMQRFPSDTLSFGFDSSSRERLLELHECILPVVELHRDMRETVPEFRRYLFDPNQDYKRNTKNYGEPFVRDLFNPHITIVSGIHHDSDFDLVTTAIDSVRWTNFHLPVNTIAVVYETGLAGSWQVLRELHLG